MLSASHLSQVECSSKSMKSVSIFQHGSTLESLLFSFAPACPNHKTLYANVGILHVLKR